MTQTIRLSLANEAFDELHQMAEGRRRLVRVNREALSNLLLDHSRVLAALHSSTNHRVIEPEAQKPARIKPRLR